MKDYLIILESGLIQSLVFAFINERIVWINERRNIWHERIDFTNAYQGQINVFN